MGGKNGLVMIEGGGVIGGWQMLVLILAFVLFRSSSLSLSLSFSSFSSSFSSSLSSEPVPETPASLHTAAPPPLQ